MTKLNLLDPYTLVYFHGYKIAQTKIDHYQVPFFILDIESRRFADANRAFLKLRLCDPEELFGASNAKPSRLNVFCCQKPYEQSIPPFINSCADALGNEVFYLVSSTLIRADRDILACSVKQLSSTVSGSSQIKGSGSNVLLFRHPL